MEAAIPGPRTTFSRFEFGWMDIHFPLICFTGTSFQGVALIGLEIWTDQDKIAVSENPYTTLSNFLSWRRKQFSRIRNDNAQLITGVRFSGSTIGLAPLLVMCSEYQSGGINSDYSQSVLGVASTIAHEMGHNFGLNHDSEGCCTANPDDGGCIMAKASGHPFPKTFNQCNKRDLKTFLDSGGGKCLSNMPNTKTMYGGQRCGNGYLEEGEECDCGEAEVNPTALTQMGLSDQ
uniref:ADAM metallopeptidase domain 19b n=1 Tax=Erpetoichthys calabaricus TaxID=27687 RepID=A0A8C4SRT2_ERPCA